jgi:carboxylesterase
MAGISPMESPNRALKEKPPPPAFSFIKGQLGCLLLHGFGDTATLMEPMGTYLRAQDIGARGITLPGHGTSLEDFANVSSQRLLSVVESEYAELKKSCDSVVIVGFSMGGLLALQLATLRDVDGIVTICTPVFPRGGPAGEKTIRLAARLGGAFGANIPKLGFTSLSDKSLSEYLTGYESYPFRSVLRLLELMEITRPIMNRVQAPILVTQSSRDDLIWGKSGEYILDSVKSMEKRFLSLQNSRHKAPIDSDRHILFEEIAKFSLECAKR